MAQRTSTTERHPTMNLHRAAAALATVAVLAGCAPTGDGTSETFAPANPTSVTAAVEDILAFGQPATLSDNVTVTVSTPETFAPSANHYPDHPDGVQYRWTVTIKNGSDKPFFMGNMFFDTTIGDVAAGHYSGEGYADYQPTSLLPGKTFTRTAAVSAPTAGDVTVHGWNQVDAETQYEAYWTGPSTKAQAPSASPTAVPESAKPVPAKPAAVEAPAAVTGESEWVADQREAEAVRAGREAEAAADAAYEEGQAELARMQAESEAQVREADAEAKRMDAELEKMNTELAKLDAETIR